MKVVQEPTVEINDSPLGGETVKHPAYGQIRASRVSGYQSLYGSEFRHHNFVTITISESEMTRSLSHDWPHERRELIYISMSEAQWANFVSSLNQGSGTQCTVNHFNGENLPALPTPRPRSKDFAKEVHADMIKAQKKIDDALALIAKSNLSKKAQEELVSELTQAKANIGGNIEFVARSFDKHMEKTTEKAKIEINAFTTMTLQRAGIENLKDKQILTLNLDDKTKD